MRLSLIIVVLYLMPTRLQAQQNTTYGADRVGDWQISIKTDGHNYILSDYSIAPFCGLFQDLWTSWGTYTTFRDSMYFYDSSRATTNVAIATDSTLSFVSAFPILKDCSFRGFHTYRARFHDLAMRAERRAEELEMDIILPPFDSIYFPDPSRLSEAKNCFATSGKRSRTSKKTLSFTNGAVTAVMTPEGHYVIIADRFVTIKLYTAQEIMTSGTYKLRGDYVQFLDENINAVSYGYITPKKELMSINIPFFSINGILKP